MCCPARARWFRAAPPSRRSGRAATQQIGDIKLKTVDVQPLGPDAAREIGTFTFKTKGQPPQEVSGKYAVVWRKIGGQWLLATDIWNSEQIARGSRSRRRGCMAKKYRVAVIAGDGIGREVVPEGIAAMEAAARRYGFGLEWREFDWSCETYAKTGRMMPEDGLDQLRPFDAVFLGAVGYPGVPDHVSLWGLLIPLRRSFQQYINLRPVRLLAGVESPLRDRAPGDIDFYVVRENNEGEYSSIGGRLYEGTEYEMAMQQTVFTRRGCDRVMRYAFELARTRKKHVTSATKSNGIIHTMPYWDERFAAIAARLSRRQDRPVPHRHPDRAFRAPSRLVRRRRRLQSVRRHPVRSGAGAASARSASRPPATSTRSANTPRCSSRCTARPRTSPGAASPIRSARSGRAR